MKKLLFRMFGILATLSMPLVVSGAVHAAADTCIWTGGAATDIFSDSANWSTCDNGNLPESGDTLEFPTSVDADSLSDGDRSLNNDLTSMSFAGISVTGAYAIDDFDRYTFTGNGITVTGDIAPTGNTAFTYFELPITLGANNLTLERVNSSSNLVGSTYNVTILQSSFEGTVSGSGMFTLDSLGSGGGAGCSYGNAIPSPFSGDGSGFSGSLVVNGYAYLNITSRSTDITRHASSITLDGPNASLSFVLDNDTDMTFATPLTLTEGSIYSRQQLVDADCDPIANIKTVTISGNVTASQPISVSMYKANITMSGTVSGAEFINVVDGTPSSTTLLIGSTSKKSALLTTTYSVSDSNDYPYAGENNLVIVNAGVTVNNANVLGGVLKGTGTVGSITMDSGTVAPGMSPGCLTSGNLNYTGGTVEIEIDGATVCTQYDQQVVNGTVDLGSATTLSIVRLASYVPALNTVYTIINNDSNDAVSGTFSGLAQGATTVVNGVTYTVSYTGGDGNDVTLTVTGVAASVGAPNTGFSMLQASIALPILAILSGATLLGMQKLAFRKINK